MPDGHEARQLEGAFHLVRPKSRKGWRVIPLVPWLRDALKVWQENSPPSPHGLVWPAPDGAPRAKDDDNAEWRALQDEAKVRHPAGRYYYGHEMRHSTATLLLEAGADESTIIAILGHSSIVTSQGYMHVSPDRASAALGRVAERLQLG